VSRRAPSASGEERQHDDANVATPIPAARKRAALRLLRAREELGISQEQLAEKLGCSKRQYGSIERGRVRDIGLEAINFLLEGGNHAAAWEKPRDEKYSSSHQANLSDSGAHGGLYARVFVSGGGAAVAVMPNDRNNTGAPQASSCLLPDRAARSARLAHNQEVEGSNPSPATKRRAA
jgi:hypothetical protein